MMGKTELTNYGVNIERLNDKERKFVEEYCVDYNSKRAAIAAGYSEKAAHVQGCKLLKRPLIARAIGKRDQQDITRLQTEKEEILRRLYYLCTRDAIDYVDENGRLTTNIAELNPRARAAIDSIEQDVYFDSEGNEHIRTKLRLAGIVGCIDMAMKHKALYAPVEVDVSSKAKPVDWNALYNRDSGPDVIETELAEPKLEQRNESEEQ